MKIMVQDQPRESECKTLSEKQTEKKVKKIGGVAQVVGTQFNYQYHK
jgi:hypothetical protein